jgi:methionyl-tRNA formyltransferase
MGTPAFAVGPLRALLEAGYPVVGVMSQPDRPVGRAQTLTPPPVKALAQAHGIPVHQPGRLRREPEARDILVSWKPDLVVVVAFGQILPREILEIPPLGCLNVHASILPAYRGAAPIQWAIACGETETGVTLMKMDEGLDTGPALAIARTPIDPDETGQDLAERLAALGSQLLVDRLPAYISGNLPACPQDDSRATLAPILRREDAVIDWSRPARTVHDRVRAFQPWPGATCTFEGQILKVVRTRPVAGTTDLAPGTVVEVSPGGWVIAAGDGHMVGVEQVQIPGKKVQGASEAARGLRQLVPGAILG